MPAQRTDRDGSEITTYRNALVHIASIENWLVDEPGDPRRVTYLQNVARAALDWDPLPENDEAPS
jgi:hypothetical protein